MTLSCWLIESPSSKWKRRRPGRKFRRLSARPSRSCRSGREMRRIASDVIICELLESRKKKSDSIRITCRRSRLGAR